MMMIIEAIQRIVEKTKKRVFQVVVAESMPQLEGHLLARKLSELGVHTTVIPDAAVFAMMARVNMVKTGGLPHAENISLTVAFEW